MCVCVCVCVFVLRDWVGDLVISGERMEFSLALCVYAHASSRVK